MSESQPAVSVIIPSRNRREALRRTLASLSRQSFPLREVEVLVVADGCSDGTVEMLHAFDPPFALRVLEQDGQGAAAARNLGASHALSSLLLFLDDDIEAAPGLLEAHVSAHDRADDRVIMGYLPPHLDGQTGLFRIALRSWWERMFERLRQPGQRFRYSDLLSGNFSLQAALFMRVGGFDTGLRCHEDYELGYRLIQAGATFGYAASASGYHHDCTNLNRALERKRQEGIADVAVGYRHPELRAALPLAKTRERRRSLAFWLRWLAFNAPSSGDRLELALKASLGLWERARMRGRWRRTCDRLLGYWYWRGVAEVLGSQRALDCYLVDPAPGGTIAERTEIELDISVGLELAERQLDERRPDAIVIWYGQHLVGRVPWEPGAEPLRGSHLRRILVTDLAHQVVEALSSSGVSTLDCAPPQALAACAAAHKSAT